MEKPFAVLQKIMRSNQLDESNMDLNTTADMSAVQHNQTILDSTIAVEHKSLTNIEYCVRAIVKKKLLFKARPKPIISNATKDA